MWFAVCLGEGMRGMEFHASLGRIVYPQFEL